MPIDFNCPNCAKKIRVPDTAAGKRVRCPACSEVATSPIPEPASLFTDPGGPFASSEIPVRDDSGAGVNPYAAPLPSESLQRAPQAPEFSRGELADRGARLVAAIIDGAVTYFPPIGVFFIGFAIVAMLDNETGGILFLISILAAVIMMCGIAIYNMVLTAYYGETIGKRMMSIRVVKEADGTAPGFVHGVLLRFWVMALLNQLPFVGLVDLLMIFGEERKCLHDMIASTIVVSGRYDRG